MDPTSAMEKGSTMEKPIPDGQISFTQNEYDGEGKICPRQYAFLFNQIKHWKIENGCLYIVDERYINIFPLSSIGDITVHRNSPYYEKDYAAWLSEQVEKDLEEQRSNYGTYDPNRDIR